MEITIQENSRYGLVVSSRVIAKELGKEHSKVLRTLDEILEKPNMASLIIPSFYKVDGQKREYKEYLLTKDGFTLYMFNIQGYQDFKLAYINKFNEMEKILQEYNKIDTQNILKELNNLKQRVKEFPMTWLEVEAIDDQIDDTIKRRMIAINSASRVLKNKLKKEIMKDIQLRFGVSYLCDLKSKDYIIAMSYIFNWIEPYQLRIENTQLQMI